MLTTQSQVLGLIAVLAVFLCGQSVLARTRYDEFDFRSCVQYGSSADGTCQAFCQQNTFPFGGCDSVTHKCVCADMQLDFSDFQQVRLHI